MFALSEQAHGDGLHPAGGQAALDLGPQQRGELVADEAVDDAPGLLGVHEILVDRARSGDGRLDGGRRDFVEGDALDLVGLELEHVDEMPGDGLSLSVMVGGEVNEGGLGDQGLELGQDFLGSW